MEKIWCWRGTPPGQRNNNVRLYPSLSASIALSTVSTRQRVQFTAPGQAEVCTEPRPVPADNEVRVRTRYSAVSPGTERLVYEGNVPRGLAADASIDALEGDFSYPLSYGYACVGTVEAVGAAVSSDWKGAPVFAFHPHASHFVVTPDALLRLSDETPLRDAVLIPSLETAVTLVMDGHPLPGASIVVFGQGVVGLLTTALLTRWPLLSVTAVEPVAARRALAASMGARAVASSDALTHAEEDADAAPERADLVYELTGTPAVLDEAVAQTGYGGRLVVGSWYGTKRAPLNLGGHFHRSRMEIVSSQVSTLAPEHRGRWTKERRLDMVVDALSEVQPSRLISDEWAVQDAPALYEQLAGGTSMLQPIFVYD